MRPEAQRRGLAFRRFAGRRDGRATSGDFFPEPSDEKPDRTNKGAAESNIMLEQVAGAPPAREAPRKPSYKPRPHKPRAKPGRR